MVVARFCFVSDGAETLPKRRVSRIAGQGEGARIGLIFLGNIFGFAAHQLQMALGDTRVGSRRHYESGKQSGVPFICKQR